METEQRYLKRLWLIEHMPLILREIVRYRDFYEETKIEASTLWQLDSLENNSVVIE